MPLNSIPATTTVAALDEKRARGATDGVTSMSDSGAASCPATRASIEPLADAGVRGFKCFLVPSGVDEFPTVGERELRLAMPILARRQTCRCSSTPSCRTICCAHAGEPLPVIATTRPRVRLRPKWRRSTDGAPGSRHGRAGRTSSTCRRRAASRRSPRPAPRARRSRGETCPHYLTFAAERDSRTARPNTSVRRRFATTRIAKRCGAVFAAARCSLSLSRAIIRPRRRR